MDWLNGKVVEWLNRNKKKSTILKQKKIYSLQKIKKSLEYQSIR